MTPNGLFLNQSKQFWAYVRSISQTVGYTVRGQGQIRVPTTDEMAKALNRLGLDAAHLTDRKGNATRLGRTLVDYFAYRADVLNKFVEPRLMNKDQARELFEKVRAAAHYSWAVPMNKQKAAKKAPAYLTGIVNMIVESTIGDLPCNYNPLQPDGTHYGDVGWCSAQDARPACGWRISERRKSNCGVGDQGVLLHDHVRQPRGGRLYETLLDGMELEELRVNENVNVLHYLMVDDHYTWWECGRSYLCRIIDMLHMGYVDEVLFGSEVVERLPAIAKGWAKLAKKNQRTVK